MTAVQTDSVLQRTNVSRSYRQFGAHLGPYPRIYTPKFEDPDMAELGVQNQQRKPGKPLQKSRSRLRERFVPAMSWDTARWQTMGNLKLRMPLRESVPVYCESTAQYSADKAAFGTRIGG
jgi:hypothetical protein